MLTASAVFIEKTSLLIGFLVNAIVAGTHGTSALTPIQLAWFTAHCDQRFRYHHAHSPTWRKWLEDRNSRIDPRNQCKVWIRHWLSAYLLDPARYQRRHAACPNCGEVEEWFENHSDGFVWRECDACGHKIVVESPGESA